jgi:hypothetical protein
VMNWLLLIVCNWKKFYEIYILMNHIKYFESFQMDDVFWEREVDGDPIRVTLSDIIDYLDRGEEIDPKEVEHLLIDTKRDPRRVDSANLDYPIILTSRGGKITSILDGNHRVVRALRDGKKIRARILDLDTAPQNFKQVLL